MRRLSLAVFFLLAGCVSTRVESTWTNPTFPARRIQSFAVFGYTGSPSGRIAFEETLTQALRKKGLDAIPGYNFVTYDEWPSREEILRRLAAKNIEGVLVSKVARRTTKLESTPVFVGGSYGAIYGAGFYDYWVAPMAVATYTTEENEFVVETVLYTLDDNKPMWAARSVTSRTSPSAFARDIGGAVADGLKQAGLVAQ